MNKLAYKTSTFLVRLLSDLLKSRVYTYGEENIPKEGSIIFVANHFTRFETLLLPSFLSSITKKNIWALADANLFQGSLKSILNSLGAVSNKNPDKNLLMTQKLLTGDDHWTIFPEGLMVKNKKILEKEGSFIIVGDEGVTSPHTGAAVFALRCEFYRHRLKRMLEKNEKEAERLKTYFKIEDEKKVINSETFILPLNLSYYPINIKKNFLNTLAEKIEKEPSSRMQEEIASEISLLFSKVDININFGKPISIKKQFDNPFLESDLSSRRAIDFDKFITSRDVFRSYAAEITRDYMSQIYSLVTINHSHIFALILKYLTKSVISEEEFKLLSFLAISKILPELKKYFIHPHLKRNPIELLFGENTEYNDFIEIALSSKVIKVKDGNIKIDKERIFDDTFNSPKNFHSIRINNNIAVILNEIEILQDAKPLLKNLIKNSENDLKNRIKEFLYEKALSDFTKDYSTYYIKEESKEKNIGTPYLIEKKSNNGIGILLIHGYMASPFEVKGLAEYLGEKGFIVFGVRLKGHGTTPEDLSIRTYEDWLLSVKEGYVFLSQFCSKIFVGGFSLGGVIALYFQTIANNLAGAFAVSPPIKLKDFASNFVPAINMWNRLIKKVSLNKLAKEFVTNNPEHKHINYVRNPLSTLDELEKMVNKLEDNIKKIQLPNLIIQSHKDPVVDYKGTLKMFENIDTNFKELFLVDAQKHGILIGEDAIRIYKVIHEFLKKSFAQTHFIN